MQEDKDMKTDVATTREECQWFRVNPKTIDRTLFEEKEKGYQTGENKKTD